MQETFICKKWLRINILTIFNVNNYNIKLKNRKKIIDLQRKEICVIKGLCRGKIHKKLLHYTKYVCLKIKLVFNNLE